MLNFRKLNLQNFVEIDSENLKDPYQKTRHPKYHLICSTAIFGIVFIHVTQTISFENVSSIHDKILSLIVQVAFLSVPLFFMIRGKNNYGHKFNTVKEIKIFYIRKIIEVIFPVIFYLILTFICAMAFAILIEKEPIKLQLNSSVFQEHFIVDLSNKYWFATALIGILITAPFIGKMLQSMSVSVSWLLIVIVFSFSTIQVIKTLIFKQTNESSTLGISLLFAGWIAIAMFGYIVENTKFKNLHFFYILTFISFVLAWLLSSILGLDIKANYPNTILMPLEIIGIYLFLKTRKITNNFFEKLFRFVATHSFSIYMVHFMVIETFLPYYSFVSKVHNEINWIEVCGVDLILTFGISLFIAWVFDELLLFPLQNLCRKLWLPH